MIDDLKGVNKKTLSNLAENIPACGIEEFMRGAVGDSNPTTEELQSRVLVLENKCFFLEHEIKCLKKGLGS